MSQTELAKEVGVTQTAIGEIEAGRVGRTGRIVALAKALLRSPEWLMGEIGEDADEPAIARPEPNAGVAESLRMPRGEYLPVRGQGVGGSDGKFIMNGKVLDMVEAIPELVGVEGAYVVYVHGTSMERRYFAGEKVYVHPFAAYRRNDFVVVQLRPEKSGDPPYGYIKQFVSWDAKTLTLLQFNPEMELQFPTEEVVSVHKIVLGG